MPKQYWKNIILADENVQQIQNKEFAEHIPVESISEDLDSNESTTRRDFLKLMGFSTAAVTLAACEGPVKKAIPYVVKPQQVNPGVADYYATTYYDGNDFSSVLVRCREGRPIKVEPNKESSYFSSPNARVQASLLSLYDNDELVIRTPQIKGSNVSWQKLDEEVKNAISQAKASGKKLVLLSPTIISPTAKKLYGEIGLEVIEYDSISRSAQVEVHQKFTGEKGLPFHDFKNADLIVSIGSDFLASGELGHYEADYTYRRNPNQKMSHHIQFESVMSLTGANADIRHLIKPSQQLQILKSIYLALTTGSSPKDKAIIDVVSKLNQAGSKSLLVCGSDDVNAQTLTYLINQKLSSEAFSTSTIYLGSSTRDTVVKFIDEATSGNVGVLFLQNTNPLYTLPSALATKFEKALGKISTVVSLSSKKDETASKVNILAPTTNNFESWGDANPIKGFYTFTQPVIKPLFTRRQAEDSLIKWFGLETESYHDYLKNNWNSTLPGQSWYTAIQKGFDGKVENVTLSTVVFDASSISLPKSKDLEIELYQNAAMGDGTQANNPWLQELPDPITRATWDNYLTISKKQAEELGLINDYESNGALYGDTIKLSHNGKVVFESLPVLIQPGQAYGTLGLAFGYGRTSAGKTALNSDGTTPIGQNAFKLYSDFNKYQSGITIEKSGSDYPFALLQLHNTMMGRDIVLETENEVYNKGNSDKELYNKTNVVSTIHGEEQVGKVDLWAAHDRSIGHWFNLSVDLNSCTGCGACVVACQVENNIPVVGKEEVRKYRDMHWLRIDRYYSSEETFTEDEEKIDAFSGLGESLSGFGEMEIASEKPQVVFQPIMCQHCNHAPCETVCPVAATSHGKQGQNQMAYNRCVGTRYCANNCPYKVRRFNWFNYAENDQFDYHMNNDLGRMVLNPDVVVRGRGVMEKCSMCIQMTQASVLKAKKEGRKVKDGEFQTACSTACSTGALTFGDINNKDSQVAELYKEENKRKYYLLEAVGTRPNVFYNVKVRNTNNK